MSFRSLRRAVLAGAAVLALGAPPVLADHRPCPPPAAPPSRCLPAPGVTPPTPIPPSEMPSLPPEAFPPTTMEPTTPTMFPSLTGGLAAGVGGESVALSNVGYIDSAIPRTQLRLRYDSAHDNNRPDRAEFFYPKCGCLANPAAGRFFDPNAPGPPLAENSVDSQEAGLYLEAALSRRFSVFVETPFRFIDPEINRNSAGFADMNAGFKYALIADCDRFLTFQLRSYFPTGDGDRGLGTEHYTLEPALLAYQRLSERLFFEGEFRDWIPIDGTDFAGNTLRYGLGLSYLALDGPSFRVFPVVEFVGWTVLDGMESTSAATGSVPQDASGDTIVNAKLGVRFGFGDVDPTGFLSRSDIYVGYGRALTGEVWYKDIYRVELRLRY